MKLLQHAHEKTLPPLATIELSMMIVAMFHCRNTVGSGGSSYAHGRGVDASKSFASSSIQKMSTVATSLAKVPTFCNRVAAQVVADSSKIVCWFQHLHPRWVQETKTIAESSNRAALVAARWSH